jgi:uncharacterized membrane-anchored protein YhcB (DUF1043 family)
MAEKIITASNDSLKRYKVEEESSINKVKGELDDIKTRLELTIVKLKEYLNNDDRRLNNLEQDVRDLLSQATTTSSKLEFLEDNVADRFNESREISTSIALSNSDLKETLKQVIRSMLINRSTLKKLAKDTIGDGKLSANKISQDNSLKTNLNLLIENFDLIEATLINNSNEIERLKHRISVLEEDYKSRKERGKKIKLLFKKITNNALNYTIKSVTIRIMVYISVIVGGSSTSEFSEFVGYLIKLLNGE